MLILSDYERKFVIPRWLPFAKAAHTQELTYPTTNTFHLSNLTKRHLAKDYLDFKNSPTPHKAADLMGAAFVIGNDPIAKEVARYVKERASLSAPVSALAKHILGEEHKKGLTSKVRARISQSKIFLSEHPNNAIGWIERARSYTVLGQESKAERCVRIAVQLAPSDRFIVRSAVRFFLHSGNVDQAWDCVRRASAIQFDPWIRATEISVGAIMQKSIKNLKKLATSGTTPDNIYHYSELIASYGMLELANGNDHRAKKYFKLAWSNPSHNVVTHSEWIVRQHFPAMAELIEGKFVESVEATAWRDYHQKRIDDALLASVEWALEEPYARNAFALGSALNFQKHRYERGVTIAREGLTSTPNDFLLQNNLCFGLLKQNKIAEAQKAFLQIVLPTDRAAHVVYTATMGLLEFKKGNILLGRNLYLEAIGDADELGDRRLVSNALLHLAIAEVESNTPEAEQYTQLALKGSENIEDVSVVLTRQLLEECVLDVNPTKGPLPFKDFHNPTILPST